MFLFCAHTFTIQFPPQVLHCQSFPLISLTYLHLFFGCYIICLNSMFNSGDELIINSYRIPWLIWIQLLVMFLLIILLYFFSLDLSVHSTASESAPSSVSASSSAGSVLLSATNTAAAGFLHDSQARENQSIKETGSGSSRVITGREGASVSPFGNSHHPCHFLGLAKQAFLKCLGLDSSSESSTSSNQRKER